jgi:hypothetical protein
MIDYAAEYGIDIDARDEQVARAERERIIQLLEGHKDRITREPAQWLGGVPSLSLGWQTVTIQDCVKLIEGMASDD